MTLSAIGLALTPAGGSVCMRLKSRINLLRAAVDMAVAAASRRYRGTYCFGGEAKWWWEARYALDRGVRYPRGQPEMETSIRDESL